MSMNVPDGIYDSPYFDQKTWKPKPDAPEEFKKKYDEFQRAFRRNHGEDVPDEASGVK